MRQPILHGVKNVSNDVFRCHTIVRKQSAQYGLVCSLEQYLDLAVTP